MLSAADSARLLDLLEPLYRETDAALFPQRVVEVLAALMPADAVAFNVIHADGRVEIVHNAQALESELAKRTWALEKYIDQHPLESFYKRTGSDEPVRTSDFLSKKRLHDLALYQEFYKPLGVEYQISVFLKQLDDFRIGMGVQRRLKDFTERDKTMMGLLARHVFQAFKNARQFTAMRNGYAALEAGLNAHREGLLHLRPNGTVDSMTTNCLGWLQTYCSDYTGQVDRLPVTITNWLGEQLRSSGVRATRQPLVLQRGDNRLVIRLAIQPDGRADLLLQELNAHAAIDRFVAAGFTQREAEVLLWLSRGKSSGDIAVILGSSRATVSKHLEHIYQKLAVENRTAAAAVAFEIIGRASVT